jgi:hypothetical protein
MTVRLDDSQHSLFHASTANYQVFPTAKGLTVSTVVPGWNFGWGRILPNEEVYQILSWFLHYARQYIHRSHVAAVLMVVWEQFNVVLHPFGSEGIYERYGPIWPMTSNETALQTAKQSAINAWGAHSAGDGTEFSSPWLMRNTLDPYIHQAVFHYLRAQKLLTADFATEAVVAFDCAIQSIGSFLRIRHHLPGDISRREICERFNLSHEYVALANHAYFLRNNFGAHAGGWRWWDQHELFEDDTLSEIANLASAILSNAADQEPKMRAIDPSPSQWPTWLFENFDMLWDTVWFDKIVHGQNQ